MLPVLVGIINRTNWKKPNTQRGSFSITVQESEHTHNRTREDAPTRRALSFCVYTAREKENTKTKHERKDKTREQAKTTRAKKDKGQEAGAKR